MPSLRNDRHPAWRDKAIRRTGTILNLRVSVEELNALRREADARDISVSDYVREKLGLHRENVRAAQVPTDRHVGYAPPSPPALPPVVNDVWLDVDAAAGIAKVHRATIIRAIQANELQAVRVDGGTFYRMRVTWVRDWLKTVQIVRQPQLIA